MSNAGSISAVMTVLWCKWQGWAEASEFPCMRSKRQGMCSAGALVPHCALSLPPTHHPPGSELRVVGGGSNNKLWRRVVADAFQLPLRFPAEPEAAALGAALQAAAVHSGTPVADYVEAHPPPLGEETRVPRAK